MKPAILLTILVLAVALGGILWTKNRGAGAKTAGDTRGQKAAEEDKDLPHISHDPNGNVVITMTQETKGHMGIEVKKPVASQMNPELKGYGRVLDPAPLAALMNELAAAQAAYNVSSNELARLKMLESQGNASARVVQTAEAAALRDRLTVQSAKDRLTLSWGRAVADQKNLSDLIHSLTSSDAALVRIDLAVGERLQAPPLGVRISGLSGRGFEAVFLGPAPNVDPQMQGQGYLSLIETNASGLSVGEAVTGHFKLPGEPLSGVMIPREAVVRAQGAGWIYTMNAAGDAFTRIEVSLSHPTEAGWFITKGVTAGQDVVVVPAQQLLSIELKGQGGE